jgi:Arc/MetJ family transcription regulator
VADLFSRAGLADWTTVRTLEQTARADDDADAEVLRRYGLDGQRDALVASGATRSEPGQSTLQASSV